LDLLVAGQFAPAMTRLHTAPPPGPA
jgi:hypothetical protein